MSLVLYRPLPSSALAMPGNITAVVRNYRRSIRAIGGFWSGSFELSGADLSRAELIDFYSNNLGCRLVERTFGVVSWEGYILQMDLVMDGVNYRRTLKPDRWHNKVKVIYSSDIGERQDTGWSENTDSSDIYGEMQYVISLGGATSAAATALRDRHLAEYAWPRSRMVGGITIPAGGTQSGDDVLHVLVAGYWHTLNWRYRETSETDTASDLITTLVGESEFVSLGRIETNSLSVHIDCYPIPQRLGDLIEGIIMQGDASGNIWQGGVYEDRQMVYEQAPTSVEYYLRDGLLVNAAGAPVVPQLLRPGFLLMNANAPTGGQPPGASDIWDDPRVAYVDEVEFIAPDTLKLRLFGEEESVLTLRQQIRSGSV